MTRSWRKLAPSSTNSGGCAKKKRIATSYVTSPTRARTASPASTDADRATRPITAARRSAAERLHGQLEPALAVGARAREPGVPGGACDLAGLLHLVLGRIDDGHAELGEPLAHALVEGGGVGPFLLLEIDLLDGVEHDLLEVLRQRVPRFLVGDQPLLGGAGDVPVVEELRDLEELHRLGVRGRRHGAVDGLLLESRVDLAERDVGPGAAERARDA